MPLVRELPTADAAAHAPVDNDFVAVWEGKDQSSCVYICQALRDAEIPFRVIQHGEQVFKTDIHEYKIGVAAESRDAAAKVIDDCIGKGDIAVEDDEGGQNAATEQDTVELPAQDDEPNPSEEQDADASSTTDEAIEVWLGKERALVDMIEASLHENDIALNVEALPDGSQSISVFAHDEKRAREIVREIRDASPPQ